MLDELASTTKASKPSSEPKKEGKKKEVGPLGQRTLFLRLPRHDFGSYKPEQIRREIEKSLAPIKLLDFEPAVKKRWDPHHVKRVARGGYSGYCFLEFEDNFSALRAIEILCKNGLLGKKIDPKFCTKKREDERAQEKLIMKMERMKRMHPMKRSRAMAELEWRNSEFWGSRRPRAPIRRGREPMEVENRLLKKSDLASCPWLQSPWSSNSRRSSTSPRDGPDRKRSRHVEPKKEGGVTVKDEDESPPWQASEARRWFAERTSRGGRPRGRWVFHPEPSGRPSDEDSFYGPHDFASFPRSMRRPYWARSSGRSGMGLPPGRSSSDRGFRSIFTG